VQRKRFKSYGMLTVSFSSSRRFEGSSAFETSGTTHITTLRNITTDLNPQKCICENLKCRPVSYLCEMGYSGTDPVGRNATALPVLNSAPYSPRVHRAVPHRRCGMGARTQITTVTWRRPTSSTPLHTLERHFYGKDKCKPSIPLSR